MQRMCSARDPLPCMEEVAETCSKEKHLVWCKCKNANPPPCMSIVYSWFKDLPTGEKHILSHKCCEVAPSKYQFCVKHREDVKKQGAELARCA